MPVEDRYIINDGDIIFSWSATIDMFIYHGDEAILNQHLFKVIPSDKIDKTFLFYILKSSLPGLKELSHGVSMKHIKKGDVDNFEVDIPLDIQEQKRIASILSNYDNMIDSQKKLTDIIQRERESLQQKLLN